MPAFKLALVENAGYKHPLTLALYLADIAEWIKKLLHLFLFLLLDSFTRAHNSGLSENSESVLKSINLSLCCLHLGIVLPHKLYFMLIRKLLFHMTD